MMIIINTIQTMIKTTPIARAPIKVVNLTVLLLLLVVNVGRQDEPILVSEISPIAIYKKI